MTKNAQNLIWIDLEMTGLDTVNDSIIEIATVVTDKELNVLAEGPVFVVFQPESALRRMDDWNRKHHGDSGLIDRVRASNIDEETAEASTIEFLSEWVPAGVSPMCGNSICQDRRFLFRCMPKLEAFFHYRNLDVSTLKELSDRWAPEVKGAFKKKCAHRALDDILESIHELRYYRETMMRV